VLESNEFGVKKRRFLCSKVRILVLESHGLSVRT
jgi:hypothetical protein